MLAETSLKNFEGKMQGSILLKIKDLRGIRAFIMVVMHTLRVKVPGGSDTMLLD